MEASYVFEGKNIPYDNDSAADIEYGDVIDLGTGIAIAAEDIDAGETGTIVTEEVFDLPAITTAAFAVGQQVYWNGTAITNTPGANTPAGEVVLAKAETGAVARVKIHSKNAINVLKRIATRITGQTKTLTVDDYPSESIIVCTHATPTVTLPAVATSAGVELTIVNGGAGTTSFTIAAATACILAAGAATGDGSAAITSLVWSAANHIVGVCARFVCDGVNWILVSSNYQPTSLS